MTDIFLTTWNRPNFTERVIKAINDNTTSLYRLVVIDNASGFETQGLLKRSHEEGLINELVINKDNMGLEYTRQQATEMATTPRFVTTDSDCLPHKPWEDGDWLYCLNKLMDENPDFAAIACRTQVMIGSGNIFEHADEEDIPFVEFTCGGSLRLMDTGYIRSLGGWDRNQELRGNEEHYICGKIREAGLKCGFATFVPCYHLFGDGNWGYDKELSPEEHGHRPVHHPALTSGDDKQALKDYE
jgi:glycosyltransferase involved in cell wall biosynthesis